MKEYDLSSLRALVVEDNRHFLAILRTMLRAFGVRQIYDCIDAADALEILKKTEIDIALVDMRLTDIDGLEFAKLVRTSSDSEHPRLPIIIVSAYSDRSVVEQALRTGIDEFLVKPVSPNVVYQRICSVIERPRPYVRTAGYYGPDRRRREEENYDGPERREIYDIDDVD